MTDNIPLANIAYKGSGIYYVSSRFDGQYMTEINKGANGIMANYASQQAGSQLFWIADLGKTIAIEESNPGESSNLRYLIVKIFNWITGHSLVVPKPSPDNVLASVPLTPESGIHPSDTRGWFVVRNPDFPNDSERVRFEPYDCIAHDYRLDTEGGRNSNANAPLLAQVYAGSDSQT